MVAQSLVEYSLVASVSETLQRGRIAVDAWVGSLSATEWAVIVQALGFALAHPMLSPTLGDLAVVPALFLFGAVSGVLAVRSGDVSRSIVLHVGFNLLATLFAL